MVDLEIRSEIGSLGMNTVLLDNPSFDRSILGLSEDGSAVYSLSKMIEEMSEDDGITEEEAEEFIDYNTLRAIPYFPDPRPIIVIDFLKILK